MDWIDHDTTEHLEERLRRALEYHQARNYRKAKEIYYHIRDHMDCMIEEAAEAEIKQLKEYND